jgi:SulP family sulfate permease
MAKLLFADKHNLSLWAPALGLAVILRIITQKFNHQLIFPIYFLLIPIIFYIVVLAGQFDLGTLRQTGWVFNVGIDHVPWWHIYTYYDFSKIHWHALLLTMPTQFALLFFNILHPPLNVPALTVSLDQDVDVNHELVSHGYSNLLAGLLGSTPNYLVYCNTVIFYRVGGGSRLAGFLLAVATAVVLWLGTAPIGYLPVMLVGALIFVLGIDLVREALWDTRHRVSKTEYITILSIMVCMTIFDFVIGVLFGIALACFFFVVQNSRNLSIRVVYTGDTAISTVRRPSAHRAYLQEVGRQTMVMKLQYYLFFGTITYVEEAIRQLLDTAQWTSNPIRFLILDLSLVPGVDLSASEALVRVQHLLVSKHVTLVLCGFAMDSPMALALQSVELFEGQNVEVFLDINQAIEWTENVYLKAWFDSVKEAEPDAKAIAFPGRQKFTLTLNESSRDNTPRRTHIRNAGGRIMRPQIHPIQYHPHSPYSSRSPSQLQLDSSLRRQIREEPIPTLVKTFSGYESDLPPELFVPMLPYFKRIELPEGQILWRRGDPPDGLYVIAAGVMRETYTWGNNDSVSESMVAGTLAGELTTLAGMPRNADMVVEKAGVLWKLSNEDWALFKKEQSTLAHRFVELVLKVAKNDYDVLIGACSRH